MRKTLFVRLGIVFVCLAIVVLCGAAVTANADDLIYGNLKYKISNNRMSITITGFVGTPTSLIIPEEIDGIEVVEISSNAFENCTNLNSISLPESLTKIGCKAFMNCSCLTNIDLPDGITDLGAWMFKGTNITSVRTPVSWSRVNTTYGEDYTASPFAACDTLTTIIVPERVRILPENAFANNSNCSTASIVSISLPSTLTTIGDRAFAGTGFSSISLPDSVTSIGNHAFENCTNLNSISLPESLTKIGCKAFMNCSCLTNIDLPDGITDLGAWMFKGTNITSVRTPVSWSRVNTTYGEDYTASPFAACDTLTTIIVPERVRILPENAFANNSNCSTASIVSISLPSTLTTIGDRAFAGIGFSSISLPDSVTSIGNSAFEYCTKLNSITLPDSVTSIGNNAFEKCTKLSSISLPESLTRIGCKAFMNCSHLTNIDLPDGITDLGAWMFKGTNITSVRTPVSWSRVNTTYGEDYTASPFAACDTLTTIIVPEGVTILPENAFANNSNCSTASIVSISLPSTLTTIGDRAFAGIGFSSISLPDSVTSIGDSAFENCTKLNSITLPDSVTSIGNNAFENCTKLSSISLPESLTQIGCKAFMNCSCLTNIDLPDGITDLGAWMFKGTNITSVRTPVSWSRVNTTYGEDYTASPFAACDTLTMIIVPEGVTMLPENAFANNSNCSTASIVSISLPSTLTTIGDRAFAGIGFSSISLPDSVTSIGNSAFENCTKLNSITISDSVTSIGNGAFYNCDALTDIYYTGTEAEWNNITIGTDNEPLYNAAIHYNTAVIIASGTCGDNLTWTLDDDGVLTISGTGDMNDYDVDYVNYTFKTTAPWGEDVTSLVISDGVTSIGDCAFSGCTGLTSITIPNSVTSIGSGAFGGCTGLTSVTIPNSVTSIGIAAFRECEGLKNVTIPNSVTSILQECFLGCTGLTDITIPDSVTSIGCYAFDNCSSLTNVVIPDSVNWIGWDAFGSCSSLTGIYVGNGNTEYSSVDGVLFNKDKTWLVAYPGGKYGGYTIPDSVISIGDYAFAGCNGLTGVSIPDGVTYIGNNTFNRCTELENVNIPDSVTSIGVSAFASCDGLTSIAIPDGVTSLATCVFDGCVSLTSVTIASSVTAIDEYAFRACYNLTSIPVPSSVASIGNGAFENCDSLTDVYYTGTEAEWNNITIGTDNEPLINASIHYNTAVIIASGICGDNLTWTLDGDGVLTISGTGDMNDYESEYVNDTWITTAPWGSDVTSVVINDGVTGIGNSAFFECHGLTSITIPDSVTSIGNYAFFECRGLTSITIPDSVTSIGQDAFSLCIGLTSITIPEGVISIGNYAFEDCCSLTNVILPDSVTWIGSGAFRYCTVLTDISVGSGNTAYSAVGGVLFNKDKTWLVACPGGMQGEFVIPDSVTGIGEDAFSGCSSLTSITIPDSVTSIGQFAFFGCSGLASITIPNGVTSIGENVFYYCSGLTSVTIPDSITSIGWRAFDSCTALTDVYYNGTEEEWNQIDIGLHNDPLGTATLHYKVASGTCGNNLTWSFSSDGTLNIYGTGPMYNYNNSEAVPWHDFRTEIYTVNIQNGITEVGSCAFDGCEYLTSVSIPDSVTCINQFAFCGCYGLSSVALPATLERIEHCAFDSCTSLGTVTIPRNTTYIYPTAFMRCTSQTAILVDAANTQYCSVEGVLYSKDKKTLVEYPSGKNGSFTIPGFVTTIGEAAFIECYYLTGITFTDSVTEIGNGSFFLCQGLTSVVIPGSVTCINAVAFAYCDSLQTIEIPASVTYMGDGIFRRTVNGELVNGTVTIRCYAGSIAHLYAKENSIPYSLLDTVFPSPDFVIPSGLKVIEEETYAGIAARRVKLPPVATTIGSGAFADCSNLVCIYIPNGCTNIAEDAFSGVTNLTVFGRDGSYAEFYAMKHGFDFVAVTQ